MPIVIRELIIRAQVQETAGTSSRGNVRGDSGMQNADLEKLVSLCVEKTLKVLERKTEK